ncbi:MAG: DNA polymerase III subunit gamma/tau [Gammaproteobacteria bacterium]
MSYQVLARKWRPRNFSELVGQEHVQRALINALDHDRLHHAYLFTGTRGVGKTTIARIYAKSLNCDTGVSSTPCGACSACREIDEGRFVDLVEVDAASRTKVEDTRELLENVQYAPTRGRYKVYLIDEVHMLSSHSFNALLKTLEEPPPHVKFLLATTDPQKLPVTILSRCLQFNLKSLTIPQITGQLDAILGKEQVEAESGAVRQLAFAAHGSMRDALSLLDQAIAYGQGALREAEVCAMLGTIDRNVVYRLLEALAANDAAGLLGEIGQADEFAPDYATLLADMLSVLQRIAIARVLPDAIDDTFGDREAVIGLSSRLAPEDVQLYYQIGLIGRRDLSLAPDPRGGFEMVMLRMLVFRPQTIGETDAASSASGTPARTGGATPREILAATPSRAVVGTAAEAVREAVPEAVREAVPDTAPAVDPAEGDWITLVERLDIKGMARELVLNCALQEFSAHAAVLAVDPTHARLLSEMRRQQIEQALCGHFGRPFSLKILQESEFRGETPARRQARDCEVRKQQAVQSIEADENVKALQDAFGATVNYDSIRPRE